MKDLTQYSDEELSLIVFNDEYWREGYEPNAPSIQARINTLRAFKMNGFKINLPHPLF